METNKLSRIEAVDALRGFAVMAILLVHSLEHFIFPVYPNPDSVPEWLNVLDKGVLDITFALFAGKAYAIFSLLFGFTFYIQYTNQQLNGNDFGYRFLWRLLLLAGFATLNAAFFPAGDVLLLFSIVGIVLFITRKLSNKAVLIIAVICILQPVEWIYYIAGSINPSYSLPDLQVGEMYGEVAEYTKRGNLGEFLIKNITLGQKASLFWAIGAGRYFQTAGLFLFGMLIGRKQYFTVSEKNKLFWINVLVYSAILFSPLYVLKVEVLDNGSSEHIKQTVGVIFDMWQKFAFTFVLVASFILLYQTDKFKKLTSNLRLYGKMSLTNYISQSIVGAFIFFPIGLYLAPFTGYTLSLLIGIFIFIIQMKFCRWWLKNHKQGPLEALWHKLTWIGVRKN